MAEASRSAPVGSRTNLLPTRPVGGGTAVLVVSLSGNVPGCCLTFRVFEGFGKVFQVALRHAECPACAAPSGHGALNLTKDVLGARERR